MHWRRSVHLSRHVKTKRRLKKAIHRQHSLESEIDDLQSKIIKLSKRVEKHEKFENYVKVKRDALDIIGNEMNNYTEDEAKKMACAIALAASSAAIACAMHSNQVTRRYCQTVASISVLHEGMRYVISRCVRKLIKGDDDDVEALTSRLIGSLRIHATKIRSIFDHYARVDLQKHGDVSHISSRQMMLMINSSLLVRELNNTSDTTSTNDTSKALSGIIQLCLQQAISDSKDFSSKITLITFVLFLIRASHAKFMQFSNRETDLVVAFERAFINDIYPHVKRFDPQEFRSKLFGSVTIMNMILQRKKELDAVFAHYVGFSGNSKERKKTMSFSQFSGFVTDLCASFLGSKRALSVIKKKKSNDNKKNVQRNDKAIFIEEEMGETMRYKTVKSLLRSGVVGVVFASVQRNDRSTEMKSDTKRGSVIQRHMEKFVSTQMNDGNKINYIEFLEAVAMLSSMLYPNPYHKLSVVLKRFMNEHLFVNCEQASKAPDYDIKNAFAEAETERAKYIATMRDHRMRNLYASIRDEKLRVMGLVAHSEFSGIGIHAMLMNDDKETQDRAERTIGSKVDLSEHGKHRSLLF